MGWRVMLPGSELGEMVDTLGIQHVKLCNSGEEDPVHFLAACNSHAPLNLPDPVHNPLAFTEIMLGVDWIDDLEPQAFFMQFITDLKTEKI